MQILECSTGAYIYWGNQLSGNWNQSFILYSNELDNYWPFFVINHFLYISDKNQTSVTIIIHEHTTLLKNAVVDS